MMPWRHFLTKSQHIYRRKRELQFRKPLLMLLCKEQEEIKNVKRNVVRCFNVLKMNVCDTVPRCILHFFVSQLVDDLDRALEKENLVEFLEERKDIRDKRILCRKQSLALEKALPHTQDVLDKLLRMKQGSPQKDRKM